MDIPQTPLHCQQVLLWEEKLSVYTPLGAGRSGQQPMRVSTFPEIASANGIRLTSLTYSLYTTIMRSALTGWSPAGQGDMGSWARSHREKGESYVAQGIFSYRTLNA